MSTLQLREQNKEVACIKAIKKRCVLPFFFFYIHFNNFIILSVTGNVCKTKTKCLFGIHLHLCLKCRQTFAYNSSCFCSVQDPFGEKRGSFDYQGLLARLGATQRRLREKCPPEDNDGDSDSDTSSSGTDPDSQGSSQPQGAPYGHSESMRKQLCFPAPVDAF